MNAFLVLVTLIVSPFGLMETVTIKFPFTSVEACELYLADPAQIELEWGVLMPLGGDIRCEPKKPDVPT